LISRNLNKNKMPFSNVPVKNPGRYFEQFVKVIQPVGGANGGSTSANSPNMAISMAAAHNSSWNSGGQSSSGSGYGSNTSNGQQQ